MGELIVKITRKKHRYFGHRNCSFIGNYFGKVGDKIEVGLTVYLLLKLTGYRTSIEKISV